MKKVLMAFCLIVAACGGSGSSDAGLEWKTVEVKRSGALTQQSDAPQCSVSIQLESCKSEKVGTAIDRLIARRLFDIDSIGLQQAADSFARQYVRLYQEEMRPFYRDDQAVKERKKWYDYRYNVKMSHTSRRSHTVSCIIDVERYEGGAHSVENQFVVNFDTRSGKQITIGQLMVEGYEGRLCTMLTDELMKKTGTKSIDELRDKGYLQGCEMTVPDNYIIGDDAITFIFNPYEIASRDKGFTEIKIEKNELWKE